MSNTYATLTSIPKSGFPNESRNLYINAFVGDGMAIDLSMDKDYITLTKKQVKDLINILQARLDRKVTATGSEDMGEFPPTDEMECDPQ